MWRAGGQSGRHCSRQRDGCALKPQGRTIERWDRDQGERASLWGEDPQQTVGTCSGLVTVIAGGLVYERGTWTRHHSAGTQVQPKGRNHGVLGLL